MGSFIREISLLGLYLMEEVGVVVTCEDCLVTSFRTDATKDDKLGTLSGSQSGLVQLAALVFYQVGLYLPSIHLFLVFFSYAFYISFDDVC